ncbi:MAG: mevalonate kinase [Oscillochloris sp.]|nr:mevalonate kinase [Oscillochloris sp.]
MQSIHASAPAKLILCGEHAVVYGRPAIAVPLSDLRASAAVTPADLGCGLSFHAPDLGGAWSEDENPTDPLCELAQMTLQQFGRHPANLRVSLRSMIPIASGMGSGAAIGTALVRALAAYAGYEPTPAEVSALVYASEQRFHGTPSGIDNTVIAYEQAIWYLRGDPPTIAPLRVGEPLQLVIGDTGIRSATRLPVAAVRERWQADQPTFERFFDLIADLVVRARAALAAGEAIVLGALLDENQHLLEQIGVSSPELNRLVNAARTAGALGAKLSGAGWGGVMFALATPDTGERVGRALSAAGAKRVLHTTVTAS